MELATYLHPSPLGALLLVAHGSRLAGVYFEQHRPAPRWIAPPPLRDDVAVLRRAAEQLDEYFGGARDRFELPLALEGTAFQREVWSALATIPFGMSWDYATLARAVGRPRAARAVGAANARNPLSIVLPCHRVIGASGALTGYAGGLARKEWLLAHEARGGMRRVG
jgi:methylated-DNA-[protein]-cysteine S-methyltransferase